MTTEKGAATCVPQKKFLVIDEVDHIPGKSGRSYPFRLRVWRAKEAEAVVLVSQVDGGPPPSWLQTRIANYVWKAILRYPVEGMFFFTDASFMNQRILAQVAFDTFGQDQRCSLFNPLERPRQWHVLLAMIGEVSL